MIKGGLVVPHMNWSFYLKYIYSYFLVTKSPCCFFILIILKRVFNWQLTYYILTTCFSPSNAVPVDGLPRSWKQKEKGVAFQVLTASYLLRSGLSAIRSAGRVFTRD